MSKPKYKKDDWMVVKANDDLYGGMMGQIVKVSPPYTHHSNPVTVYTIKFDDGRIDDFSGYELKTPTPEQSRKYSMEHLEKGFAIAEQIFNKDAILCNDAKETPKASPVVKDVDWSDFKIEADKEWESFVK